MITLINCFEVPPGREEDFFSAFKTVNAYMRAKPGYISHKMHRSLTPDACYRFVNVVQWASPEACEAAHDEDFRALISQPGLSGVQSTPALYQVVHQATAED